MVTAREDEPFNRCITEGRSSSVGTRSSKCTWSYSVTASMSWTPSSRDNFRELSQNEVTQLVHEDPSAPFSAKPDMEQRHPAILNAKLRVSNLQRPYCRDVA